MLLFVKNIRYFISSKTRMRANKDNAYLVYVLGIITSVRASFTSWTCFKKPWNSNGSSWLPISSNIFFLPRFVYHPPRAQPPPLELHASRERSIINGVKKARLAKYNATIQAHRDVSSKQQIRKWIPPWFYMVKNECRRARDR